MDNRLSGATRYSGDPADADIFLLRFSSTAQQLDFSPVYDGTERHSAPPNNQTAVLAMPETTWHERTEKQELLAENKKFLKKCVDSPTVAQALASPDAEKWRTAMDKEVQQLEAMNVWELVDRDSLPPGARVRVCTCAMSCQSHMCSHACT